MASRLGLVAAGMLTLLAAGCSGGPVDGAEEAVALARGTSAAGGAVLNSCLMGAGYNTMDAGALANEVEVRSFRGGGDFHLVTFTSGADRIRLTVITDRQFVYPYDEAAVTLLDKAGCALDSDPLNETST